MDHLRRSIIGGSGLVARWNAITSRNQLVHPPRRARAAAEHLILDLVNVVLHPSDDRRVVVQHPVHDRVQNRHGPPPQQIGPRLERAAYRCDVGRLPVADGHDEMRTREDVDLAEFNRLGLVDVTRRA